ncbi:hypothetical protein F2P56_031885 [Juglans regia]|uniref:Uncharacterized protein n=1 Tax=Juglans regia TaxID=51240 RepID=A0A833X7R6_JUGRE|nr:hypothetical protein F2P56_031885 [Juglans regia]
MIRDHASYDSSGIGDRGLLEEGEDSPPEGMSPREAIIRLMLVERSRLKLRDLFFSSLEKMVDDLERMRYTKAWTRANMATFISMSAKLPSITILDSELILQEKRFTFLEQMR